MRIVLAVAAGVLLACSGARAAPDDCVSFDEKLTLAKFTESSLASASSIMQGRSETDAEQRMLHRLAVSYVYHMSTEIMGLLDVFELSGHTRDSEIAPVREKLRKRADAAHETVGNLVTLLEKIGPVISDPQASRLVKAIARDGRRQALEALAHAKACL